MKITDITAWPVALPAGGEARPHLFVTVTTDDGIVGLGEATDGAGCAYAHLVATVVDEALTPLALGEDPAAIDRLVRKLRGHTRRRLGDQWTVVQAIGAVELALWDVAGKAANASAGELTGRFAEDAEVCVAAGHLRQAGPWPADLAGTTGPDPAALVDRVAPYLERGVRHVSVGIGPDVDEDAEAVAELRRLLGADVELAVDGGECCTVPTALRVAALLAELDVAWYEEPVPQHHRAALRTVAERSPVPVAYGRHLFGTHDVQALLHDADVGVVHQDATIAGGIAEGRRVAALAEHAGVRMVARAAGGPVAVAAALHLATTSPNVGLVEAAVAGAGSAAAPWVLGRLAAGRLAAPGGAGLGIDLDPSVLDPAPPAPVPGFAMPRHGMGTA